MNKSLIIIVVLILLIGVAIYLAGTNNPEIVNEAEENTSLETENTDTDTNTDNNEPIPVEPDNGTGASAPTNSVLLQSAVTGNFATVARATLTEPGFVVIYRVNSNSQTDILASSDLLLPGTYNNLRLQLSSAIARGQTIVAVLHKDNGDGKFESDLYLGNSSQPVVTDVDVVDIPDDEENEKLQLQVETFLKANQQ